MCITYITRVKFLLTGDNENIPVDNSKHDVNILCFHAEFVYCIESALVVQCDCSSSV